MLQEDRKERVRWSEQDGDVPGNVARLRYDLERRRVRSVQTQAQFQDHFNQRAVRTSGEFPSGRVWMDLGAGSGTFFGALAPQRPDVHFVGIERCRDRARQLARIAARTTTKNMIGIRGNGVPAFVHVVPKGSLERLFILYPCPWPKSSQRNNRWYLHPVMPHIVEALRPGGQIVLASDQRFYVDEAKLTLESVYGFRIETYGLLAPNAWNELGTFPAGRTKFERTFIEREAPCFELVATKPGGDSTA